MWLLSCWLFGCLFRLAAFLLMFLVSPSRVSHFCRAKVTKTLRPVIRPWLRQGRMAGVRFFCLLFFALGGNPSSKKSESPEGAKQGVSENTQSGVQNTNQDNKTTHKLASPVSNLTFPRLHEEP